MLWTTKKYSLNSDYKRFLVALNDFLINVRKLIYSFQLCLFLGDTAINGLRETYEILSESIDVIKSYKELVEEIIDEYGLDIDEDWT